MATLSLQALNEVIQARQTLHGGTRGAPIMLADGTREGAALNKACVVLMTASLQAYIEDVFVAVSSQAFGHALEGDQLKNYRQTWSRWGNPSSSNITLLFRRLGIDDVFEGLSWQRMPTPTLKRRLDNINQVRNCIAHGSELRLDGKAFSLSLANINRWKDSIEVFGRKFEIHASSKVR